MIATITIHPPPPSYPLPIFNCIALASTANTLKCKNSTEKLNNGNHKLPSAPAIKYCLLKEKCEQLSAKSEKHISSDGPC